MVLPTFSWEFGSFAPPPRLHNRIDFPNLDNADPEDGQPAGRDQSRASLVSRVLGLPSFYVCEERLAAALEAKKLLFLTDVTGILDRDGQLLSTLNSATIARLTADGVIAGGMLPKVDACLKALEHGVAKTHIIDGRVPHAVLLELFTDQGIGTEIVR